MRRSTRSHCFAIVLACLAALFAKAAHAAPPAGAQWELAWSDEFNGTSVNQTLWEFWLAGQQRRAAINDPANTFVQNGTLTVRTRKVNDVLTSGGLQSKAGFGFGYYEVRARVISGWATFWLQSPGIGSGVGDPARYGTEIDVQEGCCPGRVQHAVHWDGYDANHKQATGGISTALVPNQQDYNLYGVEWTADAYRFWVNGQLSWTFTTAVSHRSDQWIRLTQETDGDFCGGECLYIVDYVRGYRRVGDGGGSGAGGASTGGTGGAPPTQPVPIPTFAIIALGLALGAMGIAATRRRE